MSLIKKILKALSVIVGLFILMTIIMFIFKLCPPNGLWISPPWCNNEQSHSHFNLLKKERLVNFLVTVPYWTSGDVYLGLQDNPKYLKLDKLDAVTYSGKTKLKDDTSYYYSQGNNETKSQNNFVITSDLQMDAVIDWQNSKKKIIKAGFQKAVTFGAMAWDKYRQKYLDKSFDTLNKLNIDWIVIIPDWFIYPDNKGTEIKAFYGDDQNFPNSSGWITPTLTDQKIKYIITKARKQGIKVILKPHVDPINFGLKKDSNRTNLHPQNWSKWFKNYEKFILHYANLAQEENISVLVIGTELDSSIWEDPRSEQHWRKIITQVRKIYSGKLAYSLGCYNNNCRLASKIKFWDDLDYIGFEPYFGLTNTNKPSINEMKLSFDKMLNKYAKPLSGKYNKPVLLSEVNIYSYDGANQDPIVVPSNPQADHQEQAAYYEALFQSLENKDWIQGVYLWSWYLDNAVQKYNPHDVGDSFLNKPAGQVIKKWYGKIKN